MTGSIFRSTFVDAAVGEMVAGAHVLVLGLGRFGGGVGVSRWLATKGANVTVTDHAPAESLADSIDALAEYPVTFKLGRHDPGDLEGIDFVIVNPAVDKRRSEIFGEVVRRGIPWTTEINLFCRRCRGTIVGVTGSFGKSTTCAMSAAVMQRWVATTKSPYSRAWLGGNIGYSLLNHLDEIDADALVVLELSNAQLDDLPRIAWSPPLTAITNIEPHHLDRYDGFDEYLNAKLNIARDPKFASHVLYGDIPELAVRRLRDEMRNRLDRCQQVANPQPPIALRIPGRHNQHNASVAFALCRLLGAPDQTIREALAAFSGLPHRLEWLRTIGGVDYLNDSKCTSLRAMVASVQAMLRPCVLIAGGRATQDRMVEQICADLLRSCCMIVCTGETSAAWLAYLHHGSGLIRGNPAGRPLATLAAATDLESAVRMAADAAESGHVVLFAPGAPSFDRYANFAERGEHFRAIVAGLPADPD